MQSVDVYIDKETGAAVLDAHDESGGTSFTYHPETKTFSHGVCGYADSGSAVCQYREALKQKNSSEADIKLYDRAPQALRRQAGISLLMVKRIENPTPQQIDDEAKQIYKMQKSKVVNATATLNRLKDKVDYMSVTL